MKKITITVSEKAARWARRRAAERNISVSELVRRMLENQMRLTGGYSRAYQRWKRLGSILGIDAARRLSRDEAHERE